MARVRLDDELVSQGICKDRADALRLLMAGYVSSAGERLNSAGMLVKPGIHLHIKNRSSYVGRGGLKLAGALETFCVDPKNLSCLDVGCSTGGFTDCLLQHGANHVVSVDVGRAQFDWSLRNDERVTLLEQTNIVDLPNRGHVGSFDLAVCDVSFTSISNILPSVLKLLSADAMFLTLVKPQFEAPAHDVGEGGIVRDSRVRQHVLQASIELFATHGLAPIDICVSPITGAKGNIEYFLLGARGSCDHKGLLLNQRLLSEHVSMLQDKAALL